MSKMLVDKVAIITGAGRGLGKEFYPISVWKELKR